MRFRFTVHLFRSQWIRFGVATLLALGSGSGAVRAGIAGLDLKVDIGVADVEGVTSVTPNAIQSGFSGFSVIPTQNGAAGFYDPKFVFPQFSESQVFSGVTVTIQSPLPSNAAAFFDFATDVSGTLGDLVEDGVGAIQADLRLTLSGLAAGQYQMTTYHHWADRTTAQTPFDIGVNTGSGETTVATAVPITIGFNPASISTATFGFTADGTDNVVVRLEGSSNTNASPFINGFTLISVPEPASWILLAAGFVPLWCARRISRRKGSENAA